MKRIAPVITSIVAGFALTACVIGGPRPVSAEGCTDVLKQKAKSVQLVSTSENKAPAPQMLKGSSDLLGDMLAAADAENFPVHKAGAMRPAETLRFPKLFRSLGR